MSSNQSVVGSILDQSIRRPENGLIYFKLAVKASLQSEISNSLSGKIFNCKAINLPWRNASLVQPGDLIVVRADFRFFPDKLWPWEYDASLKRRSVDGVCKVKYLVTAGQTEGLVWAGYKRNILDYFKQIAGEDEIAVLMLSLSVGVRDQLSKSTERIFKDFGISHVLVLSGMQIGLIYFSLSVFVKYLLRRSGLAVQFRLQLAAVIAATVSLTLVAVTDFEASALRAWIACILFSVAGLNERKTELFRGSLASLLVLCLIWPGCWAEAGVQLSFAAVFGIAFGQALARNKFQTLILPCLLATIFSSFLSSLWFEQISLNSIISNLILTPLFGVLGCYLGILALFSCLLPEYLSLQIVVLLKYILQQLFDICLMLHKLLPGVMVLESIDFVFVAITLLLLFVLCSFRQIDLWIKEYNLFAPR